MIGRSGYAAVAVPALVDLEPGQAQRNGRRPPDVLDARERRRHHVQRQKRQMARGQLRDGLEQSFRAPRDDGTIALAQDNRKFVALNARDKLSVLQLRCKTPRDRRQKFVPGFLTEGVVGFLEMVEVHHQQ